MLEEAVKAARLQGQQEEPATIVHLAITGATYVGPYAEADAANTLALFENLNPILDQEGTRDAYRLDVDLLPMVHGMRRRGIRIDQSAAEQARDYCLQKRDAALAELSEQLGTPVGMDEIASRKWLVQTFDAHGIDYPRTAKGNPSFKAGKTGWMGEHQHWLPRLIATANKYEHAGSTFLEGHILAHLIGGRIYAEINPFRSEDGGARSFRFSYSNPPLQQMPSRDEELAPLIRRAFLPEEGEVWAESDVSQQEFRFIVHYAVAQDLRKAMEAAERYRTDPDADFHQLVATWTGLDRKSAKGVNFGRLYGMGLRAFAAMIGKPEDEARAIYAKYDRELPFVQQLAKRCQNTAAKQGYLELYDGARRHWDTWEAPDIAWTKSIGPCSHEEAERRVRDPNHPWYRRSIRRAETHKAMNALIQGSAARHTKLWMRACWREGIVPLLQMHDALACSVASPELAERVAQLGREAVTLEVPVQVDLKFGRSWGDAKHTWEELTGAAPAPKQASAPAPISESEPAPEARARAAAFGTGHGSHGSNATPAGRSPCGEEGPAAARHAVADDPQNEGGSGGARIHARPNLQHDSWTGVGAFTKIAIRSSAHTRATTATAARDRAHQAHQGRRAAHQANLPVSRRHAGERRLGLRDGTRHGRARQS